jgi:hypothetical protein
LAVGLAAAPPAAAAESYRVVVKSWPPGARVSVDQKDHWLAGVTPLTVELTRGEHLVFGELAGPAPVERFVTITAEQTVFLRFEPGAGAPAPGPPVPAPPGPAQPGDPGPGPDPGVAAPPAPVGEGTLTVATAQPLDVIVLIDDVAVGPAPWTAVVPAGMHIVTVRGLGLEGRPQQITVTAGGAATAEVEVDEVAYLSVKANQPGARVVVDGQDVGVTPLDRVPIPVTATAVSLHLRGYFKVLKRIAPKAGHLVEVDVALKRAGPRAIRAARKRRALNERKRRLGALRHLKAGTYRIETRKPLKWLEVAGHSMWAVAYVVNIIYAADTGAPAGAFIPFAGPPIGFFSERGEFGAWGALGAFEFAGLAMGLVGGLVTKKVRVPIKRRQGRDEPAPAAAPWAAPSAAIVTVVPLIAPGTLGVGLTITEF